MKITELILRLVADEGATKQITWSIDEFEGIDFHLPAEFQAGSMGSGDLSLALLQWATLRSADEEGLAVKNQSGYTIYSDDFVLLESDFYSLFDFPQLFKGTIDVSFTGSLAQARFMTDAIIELPDGGRVKAFELVGPFLSLGPNERYRLTEADYLALKSLRQHATLDSSERTEYANGLHVHDLQTAKQAGAQLRLAHFDQIEIVNPQQIGVTAQSTEEGGLVLSPAVPGTDPETLATRWHQLQDQQVGALRAKNQLVILKPEARAAVTEVLTNRKIPKEQVAAFIKNPTAYINAAMIDLDTGFSLRVHGAERFELRYFGETEAEIQDWFGGELSTPIPLAKMLESIKTEATLNDLEERIKDAKQHGADIVNFEGQKASIDDVDDPFEACQRARAKIQERAETQEEPLFVDEEDGAAQEERATVAIDDNDEETQISGRFDLNDFDPENQSFDRRMLARTPFPHQEEGIRWLLAHMDRADQYQAGGALLADDMGLGKTYMTLVAIAEWIRRVGEQGGKARPHLIVAPVSLLTNWKNEVGLAFKRSPFHDIVVLQSGEDLKAYRVDGAGRETTQVLDGSGRIEDVGSIRHSLKVGSVYGDQRLDMPNRLVLTTYQTLRDYQFSMARIDWGIVAFDEAQNIKNPNALVTRAAKGLKSSFKLIATGTPVENSLKDFWCLMDTCTPGLMGNWKSFRESYIQPILESDNDPQVKQDIGCQIKERAGTFMLRRTKEGSLEGLPTKTLWIGSEPGPNETFLPSLEAAMPFPQQSVYDDVINGVRLSNTEDQRGVALGALQALRNVCIHPALRTGDAALKHFSVNESGKMLVTFNLLHEIKTRNEKVIIFLVNKRAQQMVAAAIQAQFGIQVDIINGDTKTSSHKVEQTRQGIIDAFQARAGFDVIIMSPVAAGVGLTVTAANNVIHLERHWNPAKEAQATDRVYRIGQKQPVNVYLPVAKHPELVSFDERLNRLLRNKVDLSDAVVAVDAVSDDEMMGIFK